MLYNGLRVNWGVSGENCTTAKNTSSYSCSKHLKCLLSPSRVGHVCKCLPRYEGNGYFNGTICTGIVFVLVKLCVIFHNHFSHNFLKVSYDNGNECSNINKCKNRTLNKCVEPKKGGIRLNLGGSYNCSCAKRYKGDGFQNGTTCSSTRLDVVVLPRIVRTARQPPHQQ